MRRPRRPLNIFDMCVWHFIFTYAVLNACLAYVCFFVEYWHQAHGSFKVFGDQVKMWDEEIEAMKVGTKPVLDCLGFEPSEGRELLLGDPPL